jgi:hypothetical protein
MKKKKIILYKHTLVEKHGGSGINNNVILFCPNSNCPYEPNFENPLLEGTHPTVVYGVIISAAFFDKDVKKLVQMAIVAVPNNLIFEI